VLSIGVCLKTYQSLSLFTRKRQVLRRKGSSCSLPFDSTSRGNSCFLTPLSVSPFHMHILVALFCVVLGPSLDTPFWLLVPPCIKICIVLGPYWIHLLIVGTSLCQNCALFWDLTGYTFLSLAPPYVRIVHCSGTLLDTPFSCFAPPSCQNLIVLGPEWVHPLCVEVIYRESQSACSKSELLGVTRVMKTVGLLSED
jgi:hypothetical protein